MTLFSAGDISVRRLNNNAYDKEKLLEWLTNEELLALAYGEDAPWDMQKLEAAFMHKADDGEDVTACLIELDCEPIGYIQYYPLEHDSYKFTADIPYGKFSGGYGVDIFIGLPTLWGHGLGTRTVHAMTEYLFDKMNATVVCADPEKNNRRSVKCWEKAGFEKMGIIENYDDPDKLSILMANFKLL